MHRNPPTDKRGRGAIGPQVRGRLPAAAAEPPVTSPLDTPYKARGTAVATGQAVPAARTFALFLVPGFAMMSFSSAIEPLRAANRLAGARLYDWTILSRDGGPVTSSSGIEVLAHAGMEDARRPDAVLVVAGLDARRYADKAVFAWLRRLERQGCRVGALSTGSYILARAGLLEGRRCTIHWESLDAFREEFPALESTAEVYEIDRNRLTCSGGTAALDLMLGLIALEHGHDLAARVAEQFIHARIRDNRDSQRMTLRGRLGISHPKLLKIIGLMEENLEEPLARSELAQGAGISIRQLERLFRKYLKCTPTHHYLELRLHRARSLLCETDMSVLDVALACGFVSASHFSKCYREKFHKTPRQERAQPA